MNEGLTSLDDMGMSNQWQKFDFCVNSKAARNNMQHDQCGLIHKKNDSYELFFFSVNQKHLVQPAKFDSQTNNSDASVKWVL